MSVAGAGSGPSRRPLSPSERSCRNDEGVGQALEAMLIGALVLGAIGFTIASQAPPPPSQASGSEDLERKAWDAMQALDKMHYPDGAYGNSLLSYLMAQAAAGNSAPLSEAFAEFMPPGSEFELYLHNGYDRFPLHVNKSPDGQTVGISYPVEPNWKHHYGETDLRLYNANLSNIAMGHNLIPIFNANHVHDEGDPLQAAVEGEQGWMPGLAGLGDGFNMSFRETSYTSFIQGNKSDDSYPSANIHMVCGAHDATGSPCFATDLTENPEDGYGPRWRGQSIVDGDNTTYAWVQFAVENDGPGVVEQGTALQVHLPVGLPVEAPNETTLDALNLPYESVWSDDFVDAEVESNAPQPQTVTAWLDEDLPAEDTAHLNVWVALEDDRYAYKTLHATLAEHAASESQFLAVVEDKEGGTYTDGDTRVVLVSGPRPAGSGGQSGDAPHGRWGVVMLNPFGSSTVDEATLTLTEGQGHFDNATFPADFSPSFLNVTDGDIEIVDDNTTVKWSKPGGESVDAYSFLELQFDIESLPLDEALPASPSFPVTKPETRFTGYHPPPHAIQVESGIWWQEHPPESGSNDLPGYGMAVDDPTADNPIPTGESENSLHHRNTDIDGNTTYRMADIFTEGGLLEAPQGAIKDAVQSANMEASPQRAAPGEDVDITVDSRDFALFLSKTFGLNALDMETNVYAPWGIIDGTPAETYEHSLSAAISHDPVEISVADFGRGYEDLVVASSDGNVYGLDGEEGDIITGLTFPLPGNGRPTVLAETPHGVGTIYGIGTTSHTDEWYSFDEDFDKRWAAQKQEVSSEVLALDTGLDITDDAVPDFITATTDTASGSNDARLTLYDGASGEIRPGWSTEDEGGGVEFTGTPQFVGLANVGPTAESGAWTDTGLAVGTNVVENTEETIHNQDHGVDHVVLNSSYSIREAALEGFEADTDPIWTLRATSFQSIETTDEMDLGQSEDGDPWQGLVGAGTNGWVYGMNSSKPVNPVTGWNVLGAPMEFRDVAFSNNMEGYWASGTYMVFGTKDGLSTQIAPSLLDIMDGDTSVIEQLSLRTVDTPDGPPFAGYGNVSWWGGEQGQMLRSPDYLESMEKFSTSATIESVLGLDGGGLLGSIGDTIDLANVNFQDVYAESPTEAWYVGTGITGTLLDGSMYVVHVTEAGSDRDAYEIPCEDADGDALATCGLRGIDADDDGRLWIVGESGLVLVEDVNNETDDEWADPMDIGFDGPSECFGFPENGCNTYLNVNATRGHIAIAGISQADNTVKHGPNDESATASDKAQAPLLRGQADSETFEPVWDSRINQTIKDVAIDPQDADSWMIVGDGPIAAESLDQGETWVVLPTSPDFEGTPMYTTTQDTNLPLLMGGEGEAALHLFAGGHHEQGTANTVDLWDGAEPIESIDFDSSKMNVSLWHTGEWEATIQVHDPGHEDGWVNVSDPNEGWIDSYTFQEPVDELLLRFDLYTVTTGFTPQTPHIQGDLGMEVEPQTGSNETITLSLHDAQDFAPSSLNTLEHNEEHGYLRLAPTDNPWMYRLGNYAQGDWSENDAPSNRAEPTAMQLTPDGRYAFVATGPIHSNLFEDTPIGYDNSLYKIDVKTGLPVDSWPNIYTGDDRIRDIQVGTDYVYVATSPPKDPTNPTNIETVKIERYEIDSGFSDGNTAEVETQLDPFRMVTYHGAFDASEKDDLALILKPTGIEDGYVRGYQAPPLTMMWEDNPSVEGLFQVTYEVPRNALFGAHIVVTEIAWKLSDSFGHDIMQTARIHNSFDVTPPTKQISLAPTYNLEAIVWMEDW